MKLAETLVPLLPLTPTGFITLKADHPRRVWELDETYHAAQQTAFRDTNMAAKQKLPFRPLEPLNLRTYRDPGARYPLNPWTLEP